MSVTLKPINMYNRQKYTVPSNGVYTIDFGDMRPNYFRLNNMSDVTLYCSTSSLPSKKMYDFKANPLSVANFAEPYSRGKLYVYNETETEVDVILTYWFADFDPTFMAVGEISLNNEGVVETDGIIKGFTTELPSGNNTIGKVLLDETIQSKFDSIYQASSNNNGHLDNIQKYNFDILKSLSGENYTGSSVTEYLEGIISNVTDTIPNCITNTENKIDTTNTVLEYIKSECETISQRTSSMLSYLKTGKDINKLIQTGTYNQSNSSAIVPGNLYYVGEIIADSDKEFHIKDIVLSNGDNLGVELTGEEWNKVCNSIKAVSVYVVDVNATGSKPWFVSYRR